MHLPDILVVEDHPAHRLVVVHALRALGYTRILEAADGNEALRCLDGHGPVGVAICDIRMSGMDGAQFLRVAARRQLLGAVIISSDVSSDLIAAVLDMAALIGLRVLGDLAKPLDAQRLKALLDRHEAERQRARANAAPSAGRQPPAPPAREAVHALAAGQIVPYFQPKVDLLTLRPCGAEVLARWHHPDLGVLGPASFLEALKEQDLLDRLTWHLTDAALEQARGLAMAGATQDLALNFETSQLGSAELLPTLARALRKHALPASIVTIEMTENGLLDAPAATLENLVRLRLMGCTVSIDDFGTGFSSMQRLCHLPFNQLKIDASFVRRLPGDARSESVVAATLAMAERLGITVVAEGIETPPQHQALLQLQCRQGQGYLFARPMSGPDYARWLDDAASAAAG